MKKHELPDSDKKKEKIASISNKEIEDAIKDVLKSDDSFYFDEESLETFLESIEEFSEDDEDLAVEKDVIDNEKASIYFGEHAKIDYDSLFSYLGSTHTHSAEAYTSIAYESKKEQSQIESLYGSKEVLSSDTIDSIIRISKMDKLLGTKTGNVDIAVMERHNILSKMSFYSAMVMVKYDMNGY